MNRLPTHKRFKFQQLPKQQVNRTPTQSTDGEVTAADTVLEAQQTTTTVNTEHLRTQPFRATSDEHKNLLNPDRGCIQQIHVLMNKTLETDLKSSKNWIKDYQT